MPTFNLDEDPLHALPSLVYRAIQRVGERARLRPLAQEILTGLNADVPPEDLLVGEGDAGIMCTDKSGPCDDITFICGGSKETSFDCDDFRGTDEFCCNAAYCDCHDPFVCSYQYDCADSDVFDCRRFECSTDDYRCEMTFDFICGAWTFQCASAFDCTGGHVFLCADTFLCTSSEEFSCAATGDEACDANNPYSNPGSPDPGDFLCGTTSPNLDSFACLTDFDCEAASDFLCTDTTGFGCMNEFDCMAHFECQGYGTGQGFACATWSKFSCWSFLSDFDCDNEGGWTCTSTSAFKCNSRFTCEEDFTCEGSAYCQV